MNPGVLDAFALAIIAGGSGPAYTGMPGDPPDLRAAREAAADIGKAIETLRNVAPGARAYVSESDYFQPEWKAAYWGNNYRRLARVKARYDPQSVLNIHNGVSCPLRMPKAPKYSRPAAGLRPARISVHDENWRPAAPTRASG